MHHQYHHDCHHNKQHRFNLQLIITYPSALPQDCRLVWVVEAELMHPSQGDHHPWGQRQILHHDFCSSCSSVLTYVSVCAAVWQVECVLSVYLWEDSVLLQVGMHT